MAIENLKKHLILALLDFNIAFVGYLYSQLKKKKENKAGENWELRISKTLTTPGFDPETPSRETEGDAASMTTALVAEILFPNLHRELGRDRDETREQKQRSNGVFQQLPTLL
jgi:hypothetical protein